MIPQKFNTQTSSRLNRSIVLGLIHRHPLISRAELARLTSLHRSTITHILNELLEEKLVKEEKRGQASSRGGRCPVQLRVNYEGHYVLAVEVDIYQIRVVLANLSGTAIDQGELPLRRGELLPARVVAAIRRIERNNPSAFKQVLAIGISVPGVVDSEKGVLRLNLFHQWRDLNLKEQLEEVFGRPTLLENDANVAALGELTRLEDPPINSLLFLRIHEAPPESQYLFGVGGAIVLEGKIWHGAHACAGEVAQAINTMFQNVMQRHWTRLQKQEKLPPEITLSELLRLSSQGEKVASQILQRVADEFGAMLSQLVAFVDPEAIIVHLFPPEGKETFLQKIQRAFQRHHQPFVAPAVRFLPARLGSEAVITGIIALLLNHIFVTDSHRPSLAL